MRQLSSCVMGALLLLLTSAAGLGQDGKAPTAQLEAMKKLSLLVGEWKGESWTEFVPGKKNTSVGTETVQSKLGGLLLVIDGVHKRKVGNEETGEIAHSAFGVISYDEKAKKYRFQAYTNRGGYTEAEAKVADGKLEWGFNIPNFGDVRYTVTVNEKGQWLEIGEVSTDGKQWRRVFEMKLERVKTP